MTNERPPAGAEPAPSKVDALVRSATAVLDTAVDKVIADLRALGETDPQTAFEIAEKLHVSMRKTVERVVEVRDDLVVIIWKRDELSLGQLANRIGRAKSRADQITRAVQARQNREGSKQ